MGKLELLWDYQEADMEVVRHEGEMRRDPTRTKLLRLRNFVVDQQNALQQMEEKAEASRQQVEKNEQECAKITVALEEGNKRLEEGAYQTLEEVQSAIRDAQRLIDSLRVAEKELKKIVGESKNAEAALKDIRQKVAAARDQYATLKVGYDDEFAKQSEALNVLKQKRDEIGKGLEKPLLERYESVKQRCTPPMAKLNAERCGGCNMSLPAALQKKVRDGEQVVECENCGRILI